MYVGSVVCDVSFRMFPEKLWYRMNAQTMPQKVTRTDLVERQDICYTCARRTQVKEELVIDFSFTRYRQSPVDFGHCKLKRYECSALSLRPVGRRINL